MSHQDHDQLRQSHLDGYPREIAHLYNQLCGDTVQLNAAMMTFSKLYLDTQETRELIHDAASGFFELVFFALRNEIWMRLCRVLDPAASRSRASASFITLITRLKKINQVKLAEDVGRRLAGAQRLRKKLDELRNTRLAHTDLDSIESPRTSPMDVGTYADYQAAIVGLGEALNLVSQKYTRVYQAFEMTAILGGADSIFEELHTARRHRLCRWIPPSS